MNIGLRDSFKRGGESCRYYIWNFLGELRYAWQRAWKGYDLKEVSNLNRVFVERMVAILEDFRQHNIKLFADPDSREELSKEETDAAINEMIMHFKGAVEGEDFDINLELSDKEGLEKITEIEFDVQQHKKEALKLFCKWFDNLWY